MEEDLTHRLMTDMEPELLEFVHQYVDSFVKWDVLLFFSKNPHIVDTAENVAGQVRRATEVVASELSDLAARGILQEMQMGETMVYGLIPNAALQTQLLRFIQATEDRRLRVKIIFHVIRGMNDQDGYNDDGAEGFVPFE